MNENSMSNNFVPFCAKCPKGTEWHRMPKNIFKVMENDLQWQRIKKCNFKSFCAILCQKSKRHRMGKNVKKIFVSSWKMIYNGKE